MKKIVILFATIIMVLLFNSSVNALNNDFEKSSGIEKSQNAISDSSHVHIMGDWASNGKGMHTRYCVNSASCFYTETEYCNFGEWIIDTEPTCTSEGSKHKECYCFDIIIEEIPSLGHEYSETYTIDKKATCTVEGSKSNHCIRTDCTAKTNVTAIPKLEHLYTNACDTICNRSGCGAKRSITHNYVAATCTSSKKCKVCGATSGSKLGHSYTNACDTTCNRSGCGAKRSVKHSYKNVTTKATLKKNGKVENKCSVCGKVSKTTTIYYPKTIKLSKSSFAYNGKVQTPAVTIKDKKGNVLKKDTDYTIKYSKGRKSIGKYTVTITFKGKYSGSKKLTYTIVPKSTTGLKAKTVTSSTVTLVWSKTSGATGYKVYQYNSSKGKYIAKKTLTSTTYKITGLKGSTSYKFKVRPYKKLSDGTLLWGGYSSVLTVKTKQSYGVNISGSSDIIQVGTTKQLKATTTPSDKAIKWKSSKKSVATVSSSGKVTAKAPGTATITAIFEYKGTTYKDTYKITVKPYLYVEKSSISMKDTEKKKVLVKTDDYIETVTAEVVEGSDVVDFTWGKWDGNKIYITIEPLRAGTAKIKIYDAEDKDNYRYLKVTVNWSEPTKFGDITGNVTYFYNNYRGDVSDTGARVILIPTNGRALGLKLKEDHYVDWLTTPSSDWNKKYGIYGGKVDGKGEYYISDVPIGQYILFVISNQTSSGLWFDDEKAYAESVEDSVAGCLSKSAAAGLGKAVSFNKYYFTTVTIKNNSVSHKSVDFGITYI